MSTANFSTLNSLGKKCITLFNQIYALLDQPDRSYQEDLSADDIQDELGRFKVWAENIGALQPRDMKSSLEYRLRDASRTRQQVQQFLGDLRESLTEGDFRNLFKARLLK